MATNIPLGIPTTNLKRVGEIRFSFFAAKQIYDYLVPILSSDHIKVSVKGRAHRLETSREFDFMRSNLTKGQLKSDCCYDHLICDVYLDASLLPKQRHRSSDLHM